MADIASYLPPNTLSGVVYLCGLLHTKAYGLGTPLAFKYGTILMNPEATAEEVQVATLSFSDGIFDLQSEVDAASEVDLKTRRLRRWDLARLRVASNRKSSTLRQLSRPRQQLSLYAWLAGLPGARRAWCPRRTRKSSCNGRGVTELFHQPEGCFDRGRR